MPSDRADLARFATAQKPDIAFIGLIPNMADGGLSLAMDGAPAKSGPPNTTTP